MSTYTMTISIPGEKEIVVKVSETITTPDKRFFCFTGEGVEVRVDTDEDYEERKSRNC